MSNKIFIIILKYIADIDQIDKFRAKHMEFLEDYYNKGTFIMSGPRIPRNGGIIMAKSKSYEELQEILSYDPFYNQKLASFEIIEFMPTKFAKNLEEFKDIFLG